MLTDAQIATLERRLLEERDAAAESVRRLGRDIRNNTTSDGDLAKIPSHLADQASDVQEEAIDSGLVQRHSERLALIDDALDRLRTSPETFDRSTVSGETIPFERLELVPWTRVLASEDDAAATTGSGTTRRP